MPNHAGTSYWRVDGNYAWSFGCRWRWKPIIRDKACLNFFFLWEKCLLLVAYLYESYDYDQYILYTNIVVGVCNEFIFRYGCINIQFDSKVVIAFYFTIMHGRIFLIQNWVNGTQLGCILQTCGQFAWTHTDYCIFDLGDGMTDKEMGL